MSEYKRITRRELLRYGTLAGTVVLVGACQPKVVEKVVKETVIVAGTPEVVKETVIVAGTPEVIEKEVTKIVAGTPKVVKETVIVEKAAQEPVTIYPVVMNYSWDEAQQAFFKEFQKTHPNIQAKFTVVPGFGDYPLKAAAMFASATLGDVVEYNQGPKFYAWKFTGMIRPLNDLVDATGFDIDAFYPCGVQTCTYAGHLIALPQDTHPGMVSVHWNANLLAELNVPDPTSDWEYDQFIDTCKKLIRDTDNDGKTDIWAYTHWFGLGNMTNRLRANGGDVYDEEGKKCLFDQPPAILTLQQNQDLIVKHKVHPSPGDQTAFDADAMYRSGKLAMRGVTPTHVINITKATEKDFVTKACTMAKSVETGKVASAPTGMGYAITTLAKDPQEVWEWLQFMGGHWYGVQMFFQGYGAPGGRKDTWRDPEVVAQWPLAGETADMLDVAEPQRFPWNLREAEISSVHSAIVAEMLLDRMTPEEAGKQITAEVDAILAQPML